MPILQRQLLREMLINALVTFGVVVLIFVIGGSLTILHGTNYLTLELFGRLVLFFIGTRLSTILPMTVLIAAMFTYGRAAAENEINAMRASGIHLSYVFLPGILFGLLTSAFALHVNDEVAARMQFAWNAVSEENFASALSSLAERGDHGLDISKREKLFWESRDPETGYFRNLRIKRYQDAKKDGAQGLETETFADSGFVSFDSRRKLAMLHLLGVKTLHGDKMEGTEIGELQIPVSLNQDAPEKKVSCYTLTELAEGQSRRYDDAPKKRSLVTEFHQRIAGAFACFLFVLVAMPLAVIFKQGSRMVAFLLALLVALVVYYPTFILGEVLAKETEMPPAMAIWSGSAVLLLLGVGLNAVVFRR